MTMVTRLIKLLVVTFFLFSTPVTAQKDTLYSNNICLYAGPTHTGDAYARTMITFYDSLVMIVNMGNNASFIITKRELLSYTKMENGDEVLRYDAVLLDDNIKFGIIRDFKGIKSVGIFGADKTGYIFSIVPKEAILPNKM